MKSGPRLGGEQSLHRHVERAGRVRVGCGGGVARTGLLGRVRRRGDDPGRAGGGVDLAGDSQVWASRCLGLAMSFDRDKIRAAASSLTAKGLRIGTSSWKYPGWLGQLYTRDRYIWRGRYAESRFERNCLAEYAEVFKTVCVDAAYYTFPKRESLAAMAAQVPADFQFAFKVTDEITIKQFPNQPRFGRRAGQVNVNFLNADLFSSAFLAPCETIRANVGAGMFEFTRVHGVGFGRGREFVAALDEFLGRLPRGWPYGVEIRNRNFLQPEYFSALARHGVAHED